MKNVKLLIILSLCFCVFVSSAFADIAKVDATAEVAVAESCSELSQEFTDLLSSFVLSDGDAFAVTTPDPTICRPLLLCDDAAGGTAIVRRASDCSNCAAANTCTACCGYFLPAGAARTRCCAGQCATIC